MIMNVLLFWKIGHWQQQYPDNVKYHCSFFSLTYLNKYTQTKYTVRIPRCSNVLLELDKVEW